MNELIEQHGKTLYWLIGMLAPLLVILVQIATGFTSTPLMILMLTWFGLALFIYIGVYEDQ